MDEQQILPTDDQGRFRVAITPGTNYIFSGQIKANLERMKRIEEVGGRAIEILIRLNERTIIAMAQIQRAETLEEAQQIATRWFEHDDTPTPREDDDQSNDRK